MLPVARRLRPVSCTYITSHNWNNQRFQTIPHKLIQHNSTNFPNKMHQKWLKTIPKALRFLRAKAGLLPNPLSTGNNKNTKYYKSFSKKLGAQRCMSSVRICLLDLRWFESRDRTQGIRASRKCCDALSQSGPADFSPCYFWGWDGQCVSRVCHGQQRVQHVQRMDGMDGMNSINIIYIYIKSTHWYALMAWTRCDWMDVQ